MLAFGGGDRDGAALTVGGAATDLADGNADMDVIIMGGGIGGLTLALTLHRAGIPSRVFESASELRSPGVGINVLPHATRELAALGLEPELAKVAVTTRDNVDPQGRQLVNWVAEIRTPHYRKRGWNRPGELSDFIGAFEDWHFDVLDIPALIQAADAILEFPMIDQDPLPWWSAGRITLLGDAAHPMVPRGSNGAGQAILDARALADCLAGHDDPAAALKAYEAARLAATTGIVLANRTDPPDAILREVHMRTGDRPFQRIDDVITHDEIMGLSDGYKRVAGYHREDLER